MIMTNSVPLSVPQSADRACCWWFCFFSAQIALIAKPFARRYPFESDAESVGGPVADKNL